MEGLLRVAACVPPLTLGLVARNVQDTIHMMGEVRAQGASLAVFPELGLTGATCGDLFQQAFLMQKVEHGLQQLAEACPEGLVAVVGAPIQTPRGRVNAAVVMKHRQLLGIVPKTYVPNQGDAYEKRWFRSGADVTPVMVTIGGASVTCAPGQLFTSTDGVCFGVEVGHDLLAPIPPSTALAMAGASVILNPSAYAALVGREETITSRIAQQSAQVCCGYVQAGAGLGESTTDLVFGGGRLIYACGRQLARSPQVLHHQGITLADVDLWAIRSNRARNDGFADCAALHAAPMQPIHVPCALQLPDDAETSIKPEKFPFIPSEPEARATRCGQILSLQAAGLARRLSVTGCKAIIGISGGLDSTLALLVACKAMDQLGRSREDILGITMPCFGTSGETIRNAKALMAALGIRQREVPIHEAVRQHFRDIGQDENDYSVTYENAQARERTQVLMDVANMAGALVVGTGDLSEIALGWCTYNGDHMSMYGVNGGVPKTLVKWMVAEAADMADFASAKEVLHAIVDTPISPELLPPDKQGRITQSTEALVGPYALHDFFLYYTLRYGFDPKRVYQLALLAFLDNYPRAEVLKRLKYFYQRLFSQQFKRSCSPDGVKVGTVAMSPRGDWKMPSDAAAAAWLAAVDQLAESESR